MEAWAAQCREGVLVSSIDRDTQSLVDILRFVLTFARRRRALPGKPSAMCLRLLDVWRKGLVAWIAKLADKAVLGLFLNNPVSVDQAAPAIRFTQSPAKRKYTVVTPEAKWGVLEDARDNRVSLPIVVALRAKLDEMGCHQDTADSWMRKEQAMYARRADMALSCGAGHAS